MQIAQHRRLEKDFFRAQGLRTAEYIAIESDGDLENAKDFPFPAILKTSTLGYDGKGQLVCARYADLSPAFDEIGRKPSLLENRIDLHLALGGGFSPGKQEK